jgi:hypothetical protein
MTNLGRPNTRPNPGALSRRRCTQPQKSNGRFGRDVAGIPARCDTPATMEK